jgi:type II secretion system protein G
MNMFSPRDMHHRGFTLIELLVVIAIIGLLSSVVLASVNNVRVKARDARRQSDIREVYKAIEMYYADHNAYPSTGSLNNVYGDVGCGPMDSPDTVTSDWVPGLVSGGYMNSLPQDPVGGVDTARGGSNRRACYMYASDGQDFLLSSWANIETGPININHGMYSRAGFRETGFTSQSYYCDHPNIGRESSGDYYRYSYTITNVGCTW